jgi:hypothetical protein
MHRPILSYLILHEIPYSGIVSSRGESRDASTRKSIHVDNLLSGSLSVYILYSSTMSASDAQARAELTTHFGSAVADHPDVMSECTFIFPHTPKFS